MDVKTLKKGKDYQMFTTFDSHITTYCMKKTLLILSFTAGITTLFAQTQVGNSDFEQWETSTTELAEPVNWNSFKTATGSYNSFSGKQMNRSTDVRPGSSGMYSARIWTRDASLALANGNMTLGQIVMGAISPTSQNNHNKTVLNDPAFSESFTDTPDSLVVWVKYKPINTTAGNKGRVSCAIHIDNNYRDPNDLSDNTLTKAVAQYEFLYSNGGWQRLSIPFVNVNASLTAAYIITTFTSCSVPGGGDANDTLYVDDMQLVYVPKAAFTANNTACAGTALSFTNTSTNYPTTYAWDFGDGSAIDNSASPSHTFASAGTYNVTLTVTNQWGSTSTTPYTITVSASDDASFTYPTNTICMTGANPVPTTNSAGTFSATPAGLNFVSTTTGEIDLTTSSTGTYSIMYTTNGTCMATSNSNITLTNSPDANFNYAQGAYCMSDTDPTPVFGSGANGGTFTSSPSGLVINANSGIIDLSASTANSYTITNTIAATGSCPAASSNFVIVVNANPTVSLGNFNDVCTYTSSFALSGGSPAGGTYSGTGVTSGNFDPSTASPNSSVTITYVYADGTTQCSGSATNTIFVSECLGITENPVTALAVYPNPTSGLVYISNVSAKTNVEVINALGTLVSKKTITANDNTIDLSNVNAGVYFIRVENQIFRIVKK